MTSSWSGVGSGRDRRARWRGTGILLRPRRLLARRIIARMIALDATPNLAVEVLLGRALLDRRGMSLPSTGPQAGGDERTPGKGPRSYARPDPVVSWSLVRAS